MQARFSQWRFWAIGFLAILLTGCGDAERSGPPANTIPASPAGATSPQTPAVARHPFASDRYYDANKGFSLYVPVGWNFGPLTNDADFCMGGPYLQRDDAVPAHMSLFLSPVQATASIDVIAAEFHRKVLSEFTIAAKTPITVDGLPALWFDLASKETVRPYFLFVFTRGDRGAFVVYTLPGAPNAQQRAIAKSVADGFRFESKETLPAIPLEQLASLAPETDRIYNQATQTSFRWPAGIPAPTYKIYANTWSYDALFGTYSFSCSLQNLMRPATAAEYADVDQAVMLHVMKTAHLQSRQARVVGGMAIEQAEFRLQSSNSTGIKVNLVCLSAFWTKSRHAATVSIMVPLSMRDSAQHYLDTIVASLRCEAIRVDRPTTAAASPQPAGPNSAR